MARAVPAGQVAAFSTRRGPPDPGAPPRSRSTTPPRTSSRCSSRSGSRRIPASRGAEPGLNSCARGGFARGAAQRCVRELSFAPGCYCSFAPVVTRRQSRMKRIPIMHIRSSLLVLAGVVLAGACPGAHAQAREQGRLLTASQVLEELRTTRDQSIPDRLLERAYGVAVIPDLNAVSALQQAIGNRLVARCAQLFQNLTRGQEAPLLARLRVSTRAGPGQDDTG